MPNVDGANNPAGIRSATRLPYVDGPTCNVVGGRDAESLDVTIVQYVSHVTISYPPFETTFLDLDATYYSSHQPFVKTLVASDQRFQSKNKSSSLGLLWDCDYPRIITIPVCENSKVCRSYPTA